MKELKNGELISLYMAYESEWEYRDSSIWNIVTKMFVVTLTTILIPFLYKEYCENYVPLIIFPVAGIIMDCVFLYILLSACKRYEKIGNTLFKINSMLDKKYRKEIIREKRYKTKLNYFVAYASFTFFMLLGILTIIVLILPKK